MNVLVTGAKGMMGTALVNNLKNLRDKKNRTRPAIKIDDIYEYDTNTSQQELEKYCQSCDFVFHLAGVNRPQNSEEFVKTNFCFTSDLLGLLKKYNNRAVVMFASSIQAALVGRYSSSEYGKSKLAGETLLFSYGKENNIKVAVYRFPNMMGHSRPNYNSAVSTFCWAIANDQPFTVDDRNTELELLYIVDFVSAMFDLLEGKEKHCEYEGVTPIEKENGRYCYVPITHRVTLGEIVELLEEFKQQPYTLLMPKMPEGSFAKKLYSLYLTYLPVNRFRYDIKMNTDPRGSFAELLHTPEYGQVSININ
ncbi:MAG TPA: capsular biosynthesis protein, partial [Lachnospiraceae bacterium]|nr:capsular biosynthesis protein [Lachnospiraceae bacterium]